EHGPTPLCQHRTDRRTAASMVVALDDPECPLLAWCSFGPPCTGVFFPLFLDGELPPSFMEGGPDSLWGRMRRLNDDLHADAARWLQARNHFAFLQARIDQETEEFLAEATSLKQRGELTDLRRLATVFMQHNLEQFEVVRESILHPGQR